MKFRFDREVDCPQDLAFDYFADRDKDPEWWDGVLETVRTSEIRGGVGEKTWQRCRTSGLPLSYEIRLEITDWDRPERMREVSPSGPNPYDCWYIVEKIDEERSRVILEGEVGFRGVLGRLFYPIARIGLTRQAKRSFDTLKCRLDALGAESRGNRGERLQA
jgi:hypothetical protein